jgi:hypothetical protein
MKTNEPAKRITRNPFYDQPIRRQGPPPDKARQVLLFLEERIDNGADSISFGALMPGSDTQTLSQAVKAALGKQ